MTLQATGSGLGNLNNTSWIKNADQDAFIRDKAVATVEVRDGVEVRPDIRVQLSATPNRLINLSKYLDTAFVSATWTDLSNTITTGSGVIQSNQFTPGRTYSFKVNIQDYCNPTTIKAYIQALKPVTPVQYTRTVVICHTHAKDLHLNRMLGINANGTWHTPTTGASSYLLVSSLPAHAGARIFDGASAYSEVNLIPTITHNTDAAARKVVFTYTVNDVASVLHGKTFTLNVILTQVAGK